MRRRRLAALGGLLSVALTASIAALALVPADAATSNSLTKKGTGEFANLEVTVSKTKALINETVTLEWKGGTATTPIQRPRRDFLQIMQCWGDPGADPKPDQCQFGALATVMNTDLDPNGVVSRRVGSTDPKFPKDEAQQIDPTWTVNTGSFLPFRPVSGDPVSGAGGKTNYFDVQSTNEIPVAATKANGTGLEFLEVQTATEAPGLGCGTPVTIAGKKEGRGCFLVVVPRSATEVDGTVRDDAFSNDLNLRQLQTSPLTATNWAKRIVFPLAFQPIGGNCPLGVGQTTVLGGEPATEAVSRWQTTLCQVTKTVFDYNQVPDTTGRTNLIGPKPGLGILGGPLTGSPSTGKPVYAPLTVSGLGFAVNIEIRSSNPEPPAHVLEALGRRFEDIRLTARLVAKLLTQSYKRATNNKATVPATNPDSLESDPEFRALNPLFTEVNSGNPAVSSALVSLNPTDANALVWQWIASDAEARDFIAGKPDPCSGDTCPGMVINSVWKDVDLVGRADFPQRDQVCRPGPASSGEPTPDLCPSNTHPYANDMHEAVRASSRGDTLTRMSWDAAAVPPSYKPSDPQFKGSRAMMAYADSPTAARYNLPMVRLRNASGKFVAPTNTGLAAGLAAMKKSGVDGVLAPNPGAKGDDVYPLTTVTYAATVPAGLSAADRKAYGAFIRYAVGPGQTLGDQPGQLPAGYLPLTKALKTAAAAAATAIEKYKAASPKPTPKPKPTPRFNQGPSGRGSTPVPTPVPVPVPTDTALVPTPEPTDTTFLPTPTPASPSTQQVVGATPAMQTGTSAKALLWLMLIFGLAVLGTQALPRLRTTPAPRRTGPTHPSAGHRGSPVAPPGAPDRPGGDAGA